MRREDARFKVKKKGVVAGIDWPETSKNVAGSQREW